jgi:RNA 2',3'-cyclic 3'-phosphodiesterase
VGFSTCPPDMRLFIAADIDEVTRLQLAAAQHALQSVLNHARVPPKVSWVKPAVAHVTLRFIGETPEESLTLIQTALAAVTFPPFDATWGTVGTFGGRRQPRVLHVGLTAGSEPFVRLAQQTNERLDPVIGGGASRPFTPHLTLGRVRAQGTGVNWAQALQEVHLSPTVTRVDHVTLYRSHLSSKGATYTAVSSHG